MTEPTYEFVKGQGWVVKIYPSISFVRNDKTVVLTLRQPKEGEYFHNDGSGPEAALEAIKRLLMRDFNDRGVKFGPGWRFCEGDPANVVIEIIE